jgi:subtilisin family serine protease
LGNDTEPGNRYGIDAVGAWRDGAVGDPTVYIGLVDDGVDLSHPDLAGAVWVNPWDPVNGRDDDHNGFTDDRRGWDFVNNDNSVFDGIEPFDFIDAHGTVIAGEIAARLHNKLGGAGAAPGVKIIPTKFIGEIEGTVAAAIAALDYLTDLKVRHHLNIVATNNSWGGDDANSPALQAAIQRGADQGILFVATVADGDFETGLGFNVDERPDYPAALHCRLRSGDSCMVAVTAIDRTGALPPWANWGRRTVDLGAPGVEIMSTFPFNEYLAYDGTSQAGPLVTAALALYRSRYPGATPAQTRRALLQSVTATPSMQGKTRTGGRLNVQRMLASSG